jgi:cobalt-zinc-cadmium efflux system outer membrane protein
LVCFPLWKIKRLLEIFMKVPLSALAILASAILCFSSFGWAQQSDVSPLSLQDAIRATLENNPQLATYGFRLKALTGERQTAALRPELHINSEFENLAGTGEFSGVDAAEFTLSLSSVIEPRGQRDALLRVMTARQQQLESAQRVLTLDVLAQVTHQFIAVVAAQELLSIQQQAQVLLQKNLQPLTQQVNAGRTNRAELLRAKAALARATIDLQHTRQQLDSERIKLGAFWGAIESDFGQMQANLLHLPVPLALPELLTQASNNPDLVLLADEVHLRAAELRQSQARTNSPIAWNAGIRRMQASNDSALVVGISMPLGTTKRASGAIVTATANQQAAEYQRDSAVNQLQATLMNLYSAQQQALMELEALRTDVLPLLEEALEATTNAFNQGRYRYLELNLAQRELLDAQREVILAATRVQTIHVDIQRLTGFNPHALANTASHSVVKDLP